MMSSSWAANLSSPASESNATASNSLLMAAVSKSVRFTAVRFRGHSFYVPINRNTIGALVVAPQCAILRKANDSELGASSYQGQILP